MNLELDHFFREQRLGEKRRETFGDAYGLHQATFENDNGSVAQMEQARKFVANWEQMRLQHLGLIFWGQPGNGKTLPPPVSPTP